MGRSSLSLAASVQSLDAAPEKGGLAVGLPALSEEGATALVCAANRRVLEHGHPVAGGRPSVEVLNQLLELRDPRQRVFAMPSASFNPAIAIARLVWHLGRSSDLGAIAFYEPRAQRFSDDGTTLSGSNTGARLFGAEGGIDQVRAMIARIEADPSSRRATAVVWRPEDASRRSRDIPCALALGCHLRGGRLLVTVSMRSNNALRLLPYNLFEMTMIAELIAAELGVEPASYWHSVSSLHVYDDEAEVARDVASYGAEGAAAMPSMPRDRPFDQAAALVESEARLRSAAATRSWQRLPAVLERAEESLDPYWLGLFAVLVRFSAARAGAVDAVDPRLLDRIPPVLR